MTFKPKSFTEAKSSFKPLKRGQIARPANQGFKTGNTANGRLKRSQKPGQRSKRATKTVDGDSSKAIKLELDELVREILRIRDQWCITCSAHANNTELHPGHYIRRGILSVRWNLNNVFLQCNPCNSRHEEDQDPYRLALVRHFRLNAVAVLSELETMATANPILSYVELLAIRDQLRSVLEGVKA